MGGGDKCLRPLGGRPILAQVIERAAPQVAALLLNANGDPARFAGFGLPVAADVVEGFAGPLAGVLTGMEWARAKRPDCPWIATIATDTPFFPTDLVARLLAAVERATPPSSPAPPPAAAAIRCSASGRCGSRTSCATRWSTRGSARSTSGPRATGWPWSTSRPTPLDPFFNTNRPEDLAEAERLLRAAAARALSRAGERDRRPSPRCLARGATGSA